MTVTAANQRHPWTGVALAFGWLAGALVSDAVWMALISTAGALLTLIVHYLARAYFADKRARAKTKEAQRAYDEADDLDRENTED